MQLNNFSIKISDPKHNRMANKVEQKYKIKQVIGNGICGNVHLAINRQTNQKVAIKIISKDKFRSVSGLKQFVQNERNILYANNLSNENIV